MTDMLKAGMTWLNTKRAERLATSGAYVRGEVTVTVLATMVDPDYEIAEETDVVTGAAAVDFIVSGDALGVLDEPEPGDRITVGTVVYEVMELTGQGTWVWSDAHRTMMRVHAKEVA